MSLLASYVEKFILNPATSKRPNIEDDGNEETRALVTERIEGEEGAKAAFATVSKLRLQNAELLGDTDPRYKGQKTTRKSLKQKNEVSYDPELAKFCFIEEKESDEKSDVDDDYDDIENDDKSSESGSEKEESDENTETVSIKKKKINKSKSLEDDYLRMAEDDVREESSDDDDEEDNTESDEESNNECDDEDSLYDENDEDEEFGEDGEEISKKESKSEVHSSIQTFSKDNSIQVPKGIAVKNQCHIFDKLLEARIALQKVSSASNQLPQANIYKAFLKNQYYPLYKTNLLSARKAMKKLIIQILELQKYTLQNNSETKHLLKSETEGKSDESAEDSVNDDDEEETNEESKNKNDRGTKRKLEEFEDVLKKRHKSMIPFRDETLNTWFEKSKLLVNQNKRGFGNFDISPTIQIKNLLASKDQLIKKSQLKGIVRGNIEKVLGKDDDEENSSLTMAEEYDPEIYDDYGLYSVLLDDVVKSKLPVSSNLAEASMHWITIQKLRKKSKRKINSTASKGKKLRHQTITKQQNFMAPSKHSLMSDEAINKLYTSLFGNNNVQ